MSRTALLDELVSLAQRWARRAPYDQARLARVRGELLSDTARRNLKHIPIYRGVDDALFTDDVFKSYDPRWLDDHDYSAMSAWLSNLHHRPIPAPRSPHRSIDDWLEELETFGIRVVYSSGTSGMLSFVPRTAANWAATRAVNTTVVAPMLAHDRVGTRLERMAITAGAALLKPRQFAALSRNSRLRNAEVFLLDFAGGRTGNQAISRELTAAADRHHFLFPTALSAGALRATVRGPHNESELDAVRALQREVVERAPEHFARMVDRLREAAREGHRIIIFGTPYQFVQLCSTIDEPIAAPPGSVVFCGGGWKNFSGERISRDEFVRLISDRLGDPILLEGYSMTELSTVFVRCRSGRFHAPPLIDVFVVDAGLRRLPPTDVQRGRMAFRDPLAVSYPGFIATGDEVTMRHDDCACGLSGPSITTIERASRVEIKGCAGISASLPV